MLAMLARYGVFRDQHTSIELLTVATFEASDHGQRRLKVVSRAHSDLEMCRRLYGSESGGDLFENNRCLLYGQMGACCSSGVRDLVGAGL